MGPKSAIKQPKTRKTPISRLRGRTATQRSKKGSEKGPIASPLVRSLLRTSPQNPAQNLGDSFITTTGADASGAQYR